MPESIQLIVLCLTIIGTVMLFVKWQNGRLDKIQDTLRSHQDKREEDNKDRQKDYREIKKAIDGVHDEVVDLKTECVRRSAVCPAIDKQA